MTKKEQLIKVLQDEMEETANSKSDSITDRAVNGGAVAAFKLAIKLAERIL